MHAKFYKKGKGVHPSGMKTNYIYCSYVTPLVFIPEKCKAYSHYTDAHLKRYITIDNISNEYVK